MKDSSILDISIYNQISMLPGELKEEVLHFTEFLKSTVQGKSPIKEREFGCAKNAFIMADDFDGHLDDFKDYM
jgi:hypothetical protein